MKRDLFSTNIYDKIYTDKVLIVGTCLYDLHKEALDKLSKEYNDHVLHVCLEKFHYNQYFAKLLDTLALGRIKKVGFLTVNGSPHCIQIHYARKYLQRALKLNIEYEHYVIDNEGEIVRVEHDIVEQSKDFIKPKL